MQRRLSSRLLGGAKIVIMVVSALTVTSTPFFAQTTRAEVEQRNYGLDVALTYRPIWGQLLPSSNFAMQGGSAQVHFELFRGFGLVADASGAHTSNINSTAIGLDLVTVAAGPRYTWIPPRQKKYSLYGQVLAGKTKGFNSLFPAVAGTVSSSNAIAMEAGGGVNVAISPHILLRAFEAGWLYTQLPNSSNNRQNNAYFGTGLIFRFR